MFIKKDKFFAENFGENFMKKAGKNCYLCMRQIFPGNNIKEKNLKIYIPEVSVHVIFLRLKGGERDLGKVFVFGDKAAKQLGIGDAQRHFVPFAVDAVTQSSVFFHQKLNDPEEKIGSETNLKLLLMTIFFVKKKKKTKKN